ncbi:predicted protein [Lichtheimia corymbifera JMRC:FSU:9682]|uniref:Uncharacterized protein n=1 Tax=Lichtheimia corymbifera JMRC:FSU:9682 TaxID=1263082 RepID=A0A068SF81_9FUNG|nr:predicted protein [Lichtheimia corymbifera JMRC:FSU:9682]
MTTYFDFGRWHLQSKHPHQSWASNLFVLATWGDGYRAWKQAWDWHGDATLSGVNTGIAQGSQQLLVMRFLCDGTRVSICQYLFASMVFHDRFFKP